MCSNCQLGFLSHRTEKNEKACHDTYCKCCAPLPKILLPSSKKVLTVLNWKLGQIIKLMTPLPIFKFSITL